MIINNMYVKPNFGHAGHATPLSSGEITTSPVCQKCL